MARNVIDLSTLQWQMGQAASRPFNGAPADDRATVTRWLPGRVPGDVRADLCAAGVIPPIDTPAGIEAGAWVDEADWWYRVALPAGWAADQKAFLEADGIDFHSALYLDGDLLAVHAGMSARQLVLLPPTLNEPGEHELAIRLWGGHVFTERLPRWRRWRDQLARRASAAGLSLGIDLSSERMATTKAQFGFGWDFAPRLLSLGIWDDIRIVIARGAYIQDLWAYGEPLSDDADPTPTRWRVRLRIARWQPRPIRLEISVSPENFEGSGYQTFSRTVELCSEDDPLCTSDYDFQLDMPAARRWWPWDQGEPCLYRVTVQLSDDQGVLDQISQTAGVRSLTRAPFRSGARTGELPTPWQFEINGRPVFLRGANWVPVDMLPGRVTAAHYGALLEQARGAGVNFLRVWGGGVREKQAFWDACDRLGILAWQEFPLACDFVDHYASTPDYLGLLAGEARGTIRALRNHPSLIAWCGGNEIKVAREQMQLAAIEAVLAEEDPTRPWIAASPDEGDVHQWTVWHRLAPWTDLGAGNEPFMSEFGMQALPVLATLREMFPNGVPASLAGRQWAARWGGRKAQVSKLLYYGGPAAADALPAAIEISQRVQAAAIQAGVEACRLRRVTCGGEPDGGALAEGVAGGGVAVWQLNEPWPAVSWAIIDHAGRPKAAYEALCLSYQPVLIAARFGRQDYAAGEDFSAALWVVNDTPQVWRNCRAQATLDGAVAWEAEGIDIPAAGVREIGQFSYRLGDSPQVLALTLARRDRVFAANRYDLAVPMPRPRPLTARAFGWFVKHVFGI
jgi:beta-mannosidase